MSKLFQLTYAGVFRKTMTDNLVTCTAIPDSDVSNTPPQIIDDEITDRSGLRHDFFLCRRDELNDDNSSPLYMRVKKNEKISLHFDFVMYFYDAIKWIRAFNAASSAVQELYGLCLYGPIGIDQRGAATAAKVFRAIANLLACGPEQLDLTGMWTTVEDENSGEMKESCSRLLVTRDQHVVKLNALADWADKVAASEGELFICHCGV